MTDRQHLAQQPILGRVVLPHLDQVLRADDQRFQTVIIFEDLRQGCCHQCFAQADDIADQHAAALVQMMRGDLDGGRSGKSNRLVAKLSRNAELGQTGTRFLREVVRHLDVDVVRREVSSRAQLSSMIWTSSSEISTHQRSFQRSSNHLASLLQAS